MTRALITGASGFIGSTLTHALCDRGWDVHVVARPASDVTMLPEGVQVHRGDVGDQDDVTRMVQQASPDHVFHLAASLSVSGATAPLETLIRSNVLGTANMIEAIGRTPVASALFFGTCLEYGSKAGPLAETDACAPIEPYGITKLAGTLLAQSSARSRNLPLTVFRLFTPYGPRLQKGKLITELVRRSLAGEPLLLSKPTISRDFIYIDDVIELIIEAAQGMPSHAGEIYNVGNGVPVTLEELAQKVLALTGSASSIEWDEGRQASYDADVWQADMHKTFSAFAWRPRYTLEEGLRKTIEEAEAR